MGTTAGNLPVLADPPPSVRILRVWVGFYGDVLGKKPVCLPLQLGKKRLDVLRMLVVQAPFFL